MNSECLTSPHALPAGVCVFPDRAPDNRRQRPVETKQCYHRHTQKSGAWANDTALPLMWAFITLPTVQLGYIGRIVWWVDRAITTEDLSLGLYDFNWLNGTICCRQFTLMERASGSRHRSRGGCHSDHSGGKRLPWGGEGLAPDSGPHRMTRAAVLLVLHLRRRLAWISG